jgi:hypothetical protein
MRSFREALGALLRDAALGAWLGLWLLGVGGRIAMRVVAVALGQAPVLGAGTLTVVAAGVLAGAAGALLYAVSRAVAARVGRAWVRPLRLALFAALLALVTARGLQGSPGPTWLFWVLVGAYGVALDVALVRRARAATRPALEASAAAT